MVNRNFKDYDGLIRFSIDVDDYNKKQQWSIKQLIKEKVLELKLGKDVIDLPAMPRHERKFAHQYITEQYPHLSTQSVGDEPFRKIQIII
ncbi:MAG: R3H domain-containing nucleic acid-binding protein [Candidatus Doudnabacteria bacterium]